jgi:hypothetical protein
MMRSGMFMNVTDLFLYSFLESLERTTFRTDILHMCIINYGLFTRSICYGIYGPVRIILTEDGSI